MSDPTHPDHQRRAVYSPEFSLGSVVSILTILGATIGVASYAGSIKADGQVLAIRVTALETTAAARKVDDAAARLEVLRRLERMEDTLNDIRRTQATRMPP